MGGEKLGRSKARLVSILFVPGADTHYHLILTVAIGGDPVHIIHNVQYKLKL